MNSIAIAAAAAFNLVCAGHQEARGVMFSEDKDYSTVFRVDLDQGKWCEGDCKRVNDIVRVEPSTIVLRDISKGDHPRTYRESETLDRVTGKHSRWVANKEGRDPFDVTWKGQCQLQPFTGFGTGDTIF